MQLLYWTRPRYFKNWKINFNNNKNISEQINKKVYARMITYVVFVFDMNTNCSLIEKLGGFDRFSFLAQSQKLFIHPFFSFFKILFLLFFFFLISFFFFLFSLFFFLFPSLRHFILFYFLYAISMCLRSCACRRGS